MIPAAHVLPHLTQCGIRGIDAIPYGVHLCHFYWTRRQLADTVVPFLASGLRNNERCVWLTSDPLPTAKAELAKAVPDTDAALRDGRLTIVPAASWYGKALDMSAEEMAGMWLQEEKKALARGFQGLRATGNVTGDTGSLTPEAWKRLMQYESALVQAFADRRIVALCSYGREACRPADIRDVMRHHHYALERCDAAWQVSQAPFPA
jgi:hypothetical protein